MWVDGTPRRSLGTLSLAAFTKQRLTEQAGETSQSTGGWCKRLPSPGALLWTWEGKGGPFREQGAGGEDAVTEGARGPERILSGARHLHHICMLGRGRNDEEEHSFLLSPRVIAD